MGYGDGHAEHGEHAAHASGVEQEGGDATAQAGLLEGGGHRREEGGRVQESETVA